MVPLQSSLLNFLKRLSLLQLNKLQWTSKSLNVQYAISATSLHYKNSLDFSPWEHPFLTHNNIRRFREYSEETWQFAFKYLEQHNEPLRIAFMVNMAQNMYKWARLAQDYKANAVLYLHPQDTTALSLPEWEEFDGEWRNIFDGENFLRAHPDIRVEVPHYQIKMESGDFIERYLKFIAGDRKPLLQMLPHTQCARYEVLFAYQGFYSYLDWAKELENYDVLYVASVPIAAYASGRPYCAFSVGGDLMIDSGRGDDYGSIMSLSFNAARFLMVSNPHSLGHSRRLGLTNGVYLPYPMDDSRYSPGQGKARQEWDEKYGKGIYVLMTARIDTKYKGQDNNFIKTLLDAAKERPQLRFVFLSWGNDVSEFQKTLLKSGMQDHFIFLSPVGKKKLIDYYRSCDIVLDQLVFGYYGATALEAASVGKPIIMKLRTDHYAPLYNGDVMPVFNASSAEEMKRHLLALADSETLRQERGTQMRDWLVRNHGEERTVPLMLALLRLTADRVPLPPELVSPLLDEESEEEIRYHESCLQVPE